jgi:hypothetical protein
MSQPTENQTLAIYGLERWMDDYLQRDSARIDMSIVPLCGVEFWGNLMIGFTHFRYRRGGLPVNDNPLY